MSSTGVRESNDTNKRVIKGLILNEAQFIQSLRVFANTSSLSGLGATGTETNNSPLEASGNYLAKSGDIMLGQLGNAFDTLAATNIVNDILDVSKATGTTFPIVILQGESPPTDDDLVTITQGEDVFPFQELVIRTRSSIITVKNSDNINTPDGNDLVLPVGSIIHLYLDTFLGEWVIDGGTPFFSSGGVSFPILYPQDDFGDQGAITLNVDISGNTGQNKKIRMIGDVGFQFTSPPGATVLQEIWVTFEQDGIGGHSITTTPTGLKNAAQLDLLLDKTASSKTTFHFITEDGGVTFHGELIDLFSEGNVPDPTAEFQHLQSDAANNWIAQQTLAFGANSASSAQLNIPNNTIGIAWSNATFNGDIQLKTTIAGSLDLTRSDKIAMSFTIRSQHAVEPDQSLSFTVGSGTPITADTVIDASTAKLIFAAGGSSRLTLDTTVRTELTLKSPSGITAQSAFNVISTHVTEADQSISLSVGSGSVANTDGILDTSAGKLKFAVGGANRLTIDATATTAMILASPSGITAQSSFDVISTHVTEADQNIGIFVGSGDAADAVLTTSANIFKLAVDNTTRWQLDVNIGNVITQTGFGVNPLYDLFNDDSTPNDNDLLGRINFSGRNSNSDKIIYGGILVESTIVADNAEDATMFFNIITGGIISPKLAIKSDGIDVIGNNIINGNQVLLGLSSPTTSLGTTRGIEMADPVISNIVGHGSHAISSPVASIFTITAINDASPQVDKRMGWIEFTTSPVFNNIGAGEMNFYVNDIGITILGLTIGIEGSAFHHDLTMINSNILIDESFALLIGNQSLLNKNLNHIFSSSIRTLVSQSSGFGAGQIAAFALLPGLSSDTLKSMFSLFTNWEPTNTDTRQFTIFADSDTNLVTLVTGKSGTEIIPLEIAIDVDGTRNVLFKANGESDFDGNKLVNVGDPTNPQDVVTKAFGDATYLGGGGATTLNDLTDVTISSPTTGEFLRFSGSLWVDSTIQSGDIPNLDTSILTSGILGITRGGTGNGANVRGDMLYSPTTNVWARLSIGANGAFLMSDGTDLFWDTSPTLQDTMDVNGETLDNVGLLITNATTPSNGGTIRAGNNEPLLGWRNAADNDNVLIEVNGSDLFRFIWNSTSQFTIGENEVDLTGSKLANINPTTITDFTTVTAASGDFVWIIDATDGLSKKVNASDFLGGGGTSFIGFTADANLVMNSFDITGVDDITMVGSGSILNINDGQITNVQILEFNEFGQFLQATGSALFIAANNSNDSLIFQANGNGGAIQMFADSEIELTLDGELFFKANGSFTDIGTQTDGFNVTVEGGTGRNFAPFLNNDMLLGSSTHRWIEVFALNGVINTSFSKFKKEIEVVPNAHCLAVCDAMDVIRFKWDDDKLQTLSDDPERRTLQEKVLATRTPKEERVNFGYNADVLATMCPESIKDDGVYERSVIGLLIGAVKELSAKIKELEESS